MPSSVPWIFSGVAERAGDMEAKGECPLRTREFWSQPACCSSREVRREYHTVGGGQGLPSPSLRAEARPMPEAAKAVGGNLGGSLALAKTKRKVCLLTTDPAQLSEDSI